ncbi:MAG: 3-dehydroquinate synthase family protein, partial [Pseudomonadota bacterium]
VQVPTSLLAQVDSSVGGKTGINTRHGKNLVGAFHQPSLVLADVDVLETLAARDFLAGYGEVAKYGLLGDESFFAWLEEKAGVLASDAELRAEAVRRSVQMKADIVVRDETEQGDRALLNLGHTFCHALEAATGYDGTRLLHGEGVALGCALAFDLSARLGLCSQEAPSRVRGHLQAMGMMRNLRDIPGDLPSAEDLLGLMGQDKKVVDGRLRFVLARGIGEAFVTDAVPAEDVLAVLRASA